MLHIADDARRFNTTAAVKSKKKEEIEKPITKTWTSIFGAPGTDFSDNGWEFNNDLF